jgi:hypothetical protein
MCVAWERVQVKWEAGRAERVHCPGWVRASVVIVEICSESAQIQMTFAFDRYGRLTRYSLQLIQIG